MGHADHNDCDMTDYFDLKNNGTDFGTEILAGVTTFLSSMYVILANPVILASAGMPYGPVLTATVLVTAFSSLAMGLYANRPIFVAPGMGLNHLFVAVMVRSEGMRYETALGCVFYAGLVYLVLLMVDRRKRLISGVPRMLRFGFAGGIGLFIAVIGLRSAGFIVSGDHGNPALGPLNETTLTFLAGLFFTSILVSRKVAGAFVWGVLFTTLLAWPIGRWWGGVPGEPGASAVMVAWQGWLAWPDFSLLLKVDLAGAARAAHWPLMLVFLFSCFFDSYSTCVGVSEAGDLVDENGRPERLVESLKANALGVALSGLLGTSPATAYIESSTGVRAGGRTGLTAVCAGLLTLPFLFLSPLLSLVPALATAPVLVLAGIFMLKPLIYVRWERFDEAVPFFMAMILIPMTGSITQGVIWGVLSWTLIKAGSGKFRQISPALIIFDLMAVMMLFNLERFRH